MERIGHLIWRNIPTLCDSRLCSTVSIHLGQTIDAVSDDFEGVTIGCKVGVQRHDVGGEHNIHCAGWAGSSLVNSVQSDRVEFHALYAVSDQVCICFGVKRSDNSLFHDHFFCLIQCSPTSVVVACQFSG